MYRALIMVAVDPSWFWNQEPKGSDDAFGVENKPRRDLLAVEWLFHHDIRSLRGPNPAVLGVYMAIKVKVRFVTKPNVLQ